MSLTPGRKLKAIEDLIGEYGADPTEWEFMQLASAIQKVNEWQEYLDRGAVHPDFGGTTTERYDMGHVPHKVRDDIMRRRAEVLAEAKSWRDYRVPKKRSMDVTGTVDMGLADVLQAMNRGGPSSSD